MRSKALRSILQTARAAQTNDAAAIARLHTDHVNYFGPERGPFKCGHCKWYNASDSRCLQPEVRAYVQAEGCCNEYLPKQ